MDSHDSLELFFVRRTRSQLIYRRPPPSSPSFHPCFRARIQKLKNRNFQKMKFQKGVEVVLLHKLAYWEVVQPSLLAEEHSTNYFKFANLKKVLESLKLQVHGFESVFAESGFPNTRRARDQYIRFLSF